MPNLILHHYDRSPYSELLRLALGIKGAAWRSVIIPSIAPKPDLVPLTGGYRKTPVFQIGADIYCDSAIAIEAIEAQPGPTLFPGPLGRLAALVAQQAGGATFSHAVGSAMATVIDRIPDEFLDDRKKLFGLDRDRIKQAAPHLTAQFTAWLVRLDDALADGHAFLGGDAPGYADCAAGMTVWFQGNFGLKDARLAPFAHVAAWSARVEAIGHGSPSTMTAAEALDAAQVSEPKVTEQVDVDSGFTAGQSVTVRTEDPGADPVAGTLARLTPRDIVVLREDPRVGTVAVHFPRLGQIVMPA
ncbi:glutathione S-transferase family protein [Sphingomonas sp. PB4P5]|uniref:glutathione S-transferase family protein n=1 Tax=Parasphingomonas puruogangriensis TaxID=3096155 RepID=UPI002FC5B8AF